MRAGGEAQVGGAREGSAARRTGMPGLAWACAERLGHIVPSKEATLQEELIIVGCKTKGPTCFLVPSML